MGVVQHVSAKIKTTKFFLTAPAIPRNFSPGPQIPVCYIEGSVILPTETSVAIASKIMALGFLNVLLVCPVLMLNPLIWTLIVRYEYRTRAVSRLFGSPRAGATVTACFIMGMNLFRTSLFHYMAEKGTKMRLLDTCSMATGYLIVGVGLFLVLSSAWRLGFFGIFYGDCFGILLDAKVTGFPFNVAEHPMYWGTFMIYLGDAILCASAVGFLLSLSIGLSYAIVAVVEAPFTAKIYAAKSA